MSLVQDPELINAIGSVATLLLGLVAVREWRRQHRATDAHSTARLLLLAAYSLRDGVQFVRHPTAILSVIDDNGRRLSTWEAQCREYARRLSEARRRRAALEASIAEANALWNTDVRPWFFGLINAHSEVDTYVEVYLEERDPDRRDKNLMEADLSAKAVAIARAKLDHSDEFSIKLNASLDDVAKKLRARMIR